jgi:hypothetical protein
MSVSFCNKKWCTKAFSKLTLGIESLSYPHHKDTHATSEDGTLKSRDSSCISKAILYQK